MNNSPFDTTNASKSGHYAVSALSLKNDDVYDIHIEKCSNDEINSKYFNLF